MTAPSKTAPGPSPVAAALDALGATAARWRIEPAASSFELRGRYVFGPGVTARFAVLSGDVVITDDRSEITGSLLLDAASLDSGISLRDQHLRERRSALDVDRFPTIRFDLEHAEPGRDATFDIWGLVTIRDVTRPVQLRADIRLDGDGAELSISGAVEHRQFKIDMPGLGRQLSLHARLRAVADTTTSEENP